MGWVGRGGGDLAVLPTFLPPIYLGFLLPSFLPHLLTPRGEVYLPPYPLLRSGSQASSEANSFRCQFSRRFLMAFGDLLSEVFPESRYQN